MTTEPDIPARIRRVLHEALSLRIDEQQLIHAKTLDEVMGFDSLAALEFVSALEAEFQITIEPEKLDLETLRDLPKLTAYIARRTGGPSP